MNPQSASICLSKSVFFKALKVTHMTKGDD